MSNETIETSEIEGDFLDRESLQSCIKIAFGFALPNHYSAKPAETGIAGMMKDIFTKSAPSGKEPLTPLVRAGIAHIYFGKTILNAQKRL